MSNNEVISAYGMLNSEIFSVVNVTLASFGGVGEKKRYVDNVRAKYTTSRAEDAVCFALSQIMRMNEYDNFCHPLLPPLIACTAPHPTHPNV